MVVGAALTLGVNECPLLFLMVISGLNVLAAIIFYFLGPLLMSLGVSVACLLLFVSDLLTVGG